MKYYLDTEFLEGPQKTFWGKTKPIIHYITNYAKEAKTIEL